MNLEYVARNFHLDERIREHTEQKLQKLVKFLQEPTDVRVTLELEKHRHIAEIHAAHRFGVIQATEETDNMFDAVNLAVGKAEKQARRSNKKFIDKRRRADRANGQSWPVEVFEAGSLDAGATPKIIKASRLAIEPMTLGQAALKLQSAKNDFVVFRDADSDKINVLYKRRDRNYGLITPEG